MDEARRAVNRKYYLANQERLKERAREYHSTNSSEINQRRSINRDRQRQIQNDWRARNPEKLANQQFNRSGRKRGQFVENVERLVVFERDGGICQICNESIGDAGWHVDHVVALAMGGEHSYANVQLSHAVCNLRKGARPMVGCGNG